ncbi:hypothetical protein ACHAXS_005283 [Conticribra weissflogii]
MLVMSNPDVEQTNKNDALQPRSKFLFFIAAPLLVATILAFEVLELKSTWVDCINFSGSHGCGTKQPSPANMQTKKWQQYESDEYFELCNRKFFRENLPTLPANVTRNFGASNWYRNTSYVIEADLRKVYGQVGNNIREFFKAFDMARDARATLAIHREGFPLERSLNKVFLGLDENNPHRYEMLEDRFGLTVLGPEGERPPHIPKNATVKKVTSGAMFWYKSELGLLERKHHRQYLLQNLFQITADEMMRHPNSTQVVKMCSPYHAFFGKDRRGTEINERVVNGTRYVLNVTEKYSVIHSRFFEGSGYKSLDRLRRKFEVDPKASIELPPNYIKNILTPLGMQNNSIIIITDGQNTEPINRLKSDPVIGHLIHLVPPDISSMIGDMIIGLLSHVFIGNPASSKCFGSFPLNFKTSYNKLLRISFCISL